MKTIKVVGALIVKEAKVLIAQRKNGQFDGLWEFPGGKIEINETPQEALKREIFEEFNKEIIVRDFIHNVIYHYPSFTLDMDCYLCSFVDDSKLELHDHHQFSWLDLSTHVSAVNWVPADIEVYRGLQNYFKSSSQNLDI